jgi:hypothetical protein
MAVLTWYELKLTPLRLNKSREENYTTKIFCLVSNVTLHYYQIERKEESRKESGGKIKEQKRK